MRSLLRTCEKITTQGRLFFEGHSDSKLPLLNEGRDKIANASFTLASLYLKSLPEQALETIIQNTCSLSPIQATLAHWAGLVSSQAGLQRKSIETTQDRFRKK
jgi:hypothetical protein